jgi:hypothetical protein
MLTSARFGHHHRPPCAQRQPVGQECNRSQTVLTAASPVRAAAGAWAFNPASQASLLDADALIPTADPAAGQAQICRSPQGYLMPPLPLSDGRRRPAWSSARRVQCMLKRSTCIYQRSAQEMVGYSARAGAPILGLRTGDRSTARALSFWRVHADSFGWQMSEHFAPPRGYATGLKGSHPFRTLLCVSWLAQCVRTNSTDAGGAA